MPPPHPLAKKMLEILRLQNWKVGDFQPECESLLYLIDMSSIVYKMNLELGAFTYDVRVFLTYLPTLIRYFTT